MDPERYNPPETTGQIEKGLTNVLYRFDCGWMIDNLKQLFI